MGRRVKIVLLKGKNRVVDFTTNLTMLCMIGMVKIFILGYACVPLFGAHTQDLLRRLGHIQKPHTPSFIIIVQESGTFTS